MTLRRKMAFQIAAMIVGLLLVSAASLWGLNGLHQDYGLALRGYQQQQDLFRVGSHLVTAKALLAPPNPDATKALAQIETAEQRFNLLTQSGGPDTGDPARDAESAQAIRQELNRARVSLQDWRASSQADAVASAPTAPVDHVPSQSGVL